MKFKILTSEPCLESPNFKYGSNISVLSRNSHRNVLSTVPMDNKIRAKRNCASLHNPELAENGFLGRTETILLVTSDPVSG